MHTLVLLIAGTVWAGPLSEEQILGQADTRIQEVRTGEASLKLIGPGGEAMASNTAVKIEQTRHAFLFGCNLFGLGKCKTAEENAAYEKRFAELLNYATLPFYWWGYDLNCGAQRAKLLLPGAWLGRVGGALRTVSPSSCSSRRKSLNFAE